MFKIFYPDDYVDSAYDIDFKKLRIKGYKGVLFDIDNTLVPHGEPAEERTRQLFDRLREVGLKYCLISNNKLPRVEPLAKEVNSPFIENARKPSVKSYNKAMALMGTKPSETVFVGDQLFTDVFGAKRAGMRTFLVKPIHPKEEIQIVLKRYLEKIVLYFYKRQRGK